MDTGDVTSAARKAGDSPALEWSARLGYAVSGVLHLLIGWLGIQLAWINRNQSADQSGALQELAGTTVGRLVLWLSVLGFLGLGLWQLTELVAGSRKASDRFKSLAKAVTYLVLAFTCFRWASSGSGTGSRQQSVDFTAQLMSQPAGRYLVMGVGAAIVAVGGYHVWKGWTKRFLRDLQDHPGRLAEVAGRIGYVAKGIALSVLGVLFVLAGLHGSAQEATGLDGALRTLLKAPFGQVLLTLVSLGFASYAVYSFARARHARV